MVSCNQANGIRRIKSKIELVVHRQRPWSTIAAIVHNTTAMPRQEKTKDDDGTRAFYGHFGFDFLSFGFKFESYY